MARKFVLLMVMAGAALLICSAVAFAAVRSGTEGDDRLVGTKDAHKMIGRGVGSAGS